MPRATLVQIITHLPPGGAQRVVFSLIEGQDPARFDSHLIAGPRGEWLEHAKRLPNCRFHAAPSLIREARPHKDVRALVELLLLLRRLKAEAPAQPLIVHTHAPKAGLLGRLAGRLVGARLVHTLHGLPFNDSQPFLSRTLFRFLESLGYRLGGGEVISVTAANKAKLLKAGWAGAREALVIPPGVPLPPLGAVLPAPRRRLAAFGLGSEARVIGAVASLKPPKDSLGLLQAAAPLLRQDASLHLVYVGDGTDRPALEAAIAKAGLGAQVHLMGWQDEVASLYPEFDLVALDSLSEGLPLVLVEAQAAGVPVVATRVGGIDECVLDGTTGLLVPPRDPQAFGAALTRVLAELPAFRARVAASRPALDRFSESQVRRAYDTVYTRLLAR